MPPGGRTKPTGKPPGGDSSGSLLKALRRLGRSAEEPASGPAAPTPSPPQPPKPGSRGAALLTPPADDADRHNIAFMQRYLHSGDAVLDVGANAGAYAIAAARVVGLAGRVDAIEPSPTMRTRLAALVEAAGVKSTVVIHGVMAGATSALGRFCDGTTKSGRRRPPVAGELATRVIGVESVRLDQFLAKRPYALMCMDIAGGELNALQGASEQLAKGHPPVILLAMDDALRDCGSSPKALVDWLDEQGYEIAFYDADRNVIEYPDIPWIRRRKLLAIARRERNAVLSKLADRPPPSAGAEGPGPARPTA